jgi:hypothetical protein
VPGSAQFFGEGEEPLGLTLRVVEQQHFSHVASFPAGGSRRRTTTT